MSKTPKDAPEGKTGERIMMRGRPGKGVIGATLYRPGWVEVLWDDGSDNPRICHINELIKLD